MHVCFISPHSDPQADLGEPDAGGQCVYEHELALALSRLPNTTVTTFCRDTGKRPPKSIVTHNYSIQRISAGPAQFVPKENIEEHLGQFSRTVATMLETSRSPVLHAHYWDGGKASLYIQAMRTKLAPIVWTPHSLGVLKQHKFPGIQHEVTYNFIPRFSWESYTAHTAHTCVVSSESEKQTLVNRYAIDPEKIAVITPGISITRFAPRDRREARKKLRLSLRPRLLVCSGRLTPFKGYHHAIAALPTVLQRYEQPIRLLICGGSATAQSAEEDAYRAQLQEQVHELGLENLVLFKPALSHAQMPYLYAAADVQLVVSEHEPFGLTVLEAMACGTPVVATNSGGPKALIKHNVTGCLVDVSQPSRIASYVVSLLRDDDFYTFVSQNARAYIEEDFSWDTRAQEFSTVYRSALQNPPPSITQWRETNYFLQNTLKS